MSVIFWVSGKFCNEENISQKNVLVTRLTNDQHNHKSRTWHCHNESITLRLALADGGDVPHSFRRTGDDRDARTGTSCLRSAPLG